MGVSFSYVRSVGEAAGLANRLGPLQGFVAVRAGLTINVKWGSVDYCVTKIDFREDFYKD